jgi:DNA-binding NtrC family response regulator
MASEDIALLIVDDDADLRAALTDYLSQMGVKVRTAGNVAEAQNLLQAEVNPFDIILTDLKIPGGSGLDVLKAARTRNADSLVAIITGYASIETAMDAIRLGAYNLVTKPFSLNEIGVQVRNMIERVTLSKENARLSLKLQELYQQINRAHTERSDWARLNEDFGKQVQENTRKLNQVLDLLKLKSAPISSPRPDEAVISTPNKTIHRLDKIKEPSRIVQIDSEENRLELIQEYSGQC